MTRFSPPQRTRDDSFFFLGNPSCNFVESMSYRMKAQYFRRPFRLKRRRDGMILEVFNPLDFPGWDDRLAPCPEATVFHSAAWARVLRESYGYTPCYLGLIEKQGFAVLLACMEIRSILTGRRGVSLPFTDCCEPILATGMGFHELLKTAIAFGRKAGWQSLELRVGSSLPTDIPASVRYHHHVLDLARGESSVFRGLRESTRRNIRNSQKSGVEVSLGTSAKALQEFIQLNYLTRKMHGLPPQPNRFFEKLQTHVLATGHGIVALASHRGEAVAGAVFLHCRDRAVYKYGASDRRHQHLRANNLVMWETIRWYVQNGFRSLSFGRTEPENEGLLQFKRGWGATEEPLCYTKYDLTRSTYVKESPKVTGAHNKIFAAMPMPLLRLVGSLLYRHVG